MKVGETWETKINLNYPFLKIEKGIKFKIYRISFAGIWIELLRDENTLCSSQLVFPYKDFIKNFKKVYNEKKTCEVCGSENLVKYKEVRPDTQEIDYLVHCNNCGADGDMFDINDKIYFWNQLSNRRIFESFSDNRDEGGEIIKREVNYDEKDLNKRTKDI